MTLLGLDVGTTGCRAIVFDAGGACVASAYREYRLQHPQPGWVELDPLAVWAALAACIRSVARPDIVALAVSALGEAAVPVDAAYAPIGTSIVATDQRGAEQVELLRTALDGGAGVYSITGHELHPAYTLCKLMWWRANRPAVFAQAHKFLCYQEFVLSQLGVPPIASPSLAARTLALDVRSVSWSEVMLEAAGIPRRLFPELAPSGTPVGIVPAATAADLGLPPGVVAVVGGHDQPCGGLGAGAIEPGQAVYSMGTTASLGPALSGFMSQLGAHHYVCYPHVAPGRYLTQAYHWTGGAALRWYRDTFGEAERAKAERSGRDVYDILVEEAPEEPGDLYFIPYLGGAGTPWMDAAARGLIVGLALDTSRGDLIRAILEGVTYETMCNLSYLAEAGIKLTELRAIGGGARSARWLQMTADVAQVPVVSMAVSEAAALGAAILAGVGAGVFPSVEAGVAQMVRCSHTYTPDAARAAIYQDKLAHYRRIYPTLRQLNRQPQHTTSVR